MEKEKNPAAGQGETVKEILKSVVDTGVLEKYYLSLCRIDEDERQCVSVQTAEKLMLLEIYKALCTGADII